jgi:hypothetical protein
LEEKPGAVEHAHGQHTWHTHTAEDYAGHQQPIDNERFREPGEEKPEVEPYTLKDVYDFIVTMVRRAERVGIGQVLAATRKSMPGLSDGDFYYAVNKADADRVIISDGRSLTLRASEPGQSDSKPQWSIPWWAEQVQDELIPVFQAEKGTTEHDLNFPNWLKAKVAAATVNTAKAGDNLFVPQDGEHVITLPSPAEARHAQKLMNIVAASPGITVNQVWSDNPRRWPGSMRELFNLARLLNENGAIILVRDSRSFGQSLLYPVSNPPTIVEGSQDVDYKENTTSIKEPDHYDGEPFQVHIKPGQLVLCVQQSDDGYPVVMLLNQDPTLLKKLGDDDLSNTRRLLIELLMVSEDELEDRHLLGRVTQRGN